MRLTLFHGWFLLSFVLFCGCSSEPPAGMKSPSTDATTLETPAKKIDEVELALNWLPEAEHGGFFAADVHGLFADRQLKVKIIPGEGHKETTSFFECRELLEFVLKQLR